MGNHFRSAIKNFLNRLYMLADAFNSNLSCIPACLLIDLPPYMESTKRPNSIVHHAQEKAIEGSSSLPRSPQLDTPYRRGRKQQLMVRANEAIRWRKIISMPVAHHTQPLIDLCTDAFLSTLSIRPQHGYEATAVPSAGTTPDSRASQSTKLWTFKSPGLARLVTQQLRA